MAIFQFWIRVVKLLLQNRSQFRNHASVDKIRFVGINLEECSLGNRDRTVNILECCFNNVLQCLIVLSFVIEFGC